MNSKDTLGDRIKSYENAYRKYIPSTFPVILRLDGVSFHSYTKKCKKPYDQNLIDVMNDTAIYLCSKIQSAHLAYIQSDEISILLYNQNNKSEGWYGFNINKMISVSAAMASSYFSMSSHKIFGETKLANFDCRAFAVPKEDVMNVFEWRQQDATRNSIQMLARSLASHKECDKLNCNELQDLIHVKGKNWNNEPTSFKRGRCVVKIKQQKEVTFNDTNIVVDRNVWVVDNEIPIFHKDPNYINKHLQNK